MAGTQSNGSFGRDCRSRGGSKRESLGKRQAQSERKRTPSVIKNQKKTEEGKDIGSAVGPGTRRGERERTTTRLKCELLKNDPFGRSRGEKKNAILLSGLLRRFLTNRSPRVSP